MSVEVLCNKSFSQVDREVIDVLVEFQQAMVDGNSDKLNGILSEDFQLANLFAKPLSKSEVVAMVEDKTLDYSKSDILDPTILWDDDYNASLIADIRITAKIHGNERRWISKSVVSFQKTDGNWRIVGWEN